MSSPLVLVTGASGYIAANVVQSLLEAGHRVRGTVRSLKDPAKVQPLYDLCPGAKHKLELVEADLNDEISWIEAVRGCTYVHHVASPFPFAAPKDEQEVIGPAVDGTLGVLKAAAKVGGVKRVILTSSCIAIGLSGGNKEPYTEKDWTDLSSKFAAAYAMSKHLAERAAWDFVKDLPADKRFELAVVNPCFVLGPPATQSAGTSISMIQGITLRAVPGLSPIYLNICDVRDVARAHIECMTNPEAPDNRHIVYTQHAKLTEVGEILKKEFQSQGYNPVTDAAESDGSARTESLKEPMLLDNSRMRKVLRIEPTPLEKTLTSMVYKMVELGMIPRTEKYRGPSI